MSIEDHPWFQAHPVHYQNVVRHWEQATAIESHRGLRWYADAHRVATAIAGGDAHLGTGMIAVYSPQQPWVANLLLAATALHERVGLGGAGSGVFASTAQKRAADRLLAGESYERILSGPKVGAFAQLIEHGGNPTPARPAVVIDHHALSVAHGRALTMTEYGVAPLRSVRRRDGSDSYPHYDYLAGLYHRAAAEISHHHETVAPYQVQAVTWLVRQRLSHAIARSGGMSVLDKGREQARLNAEAAWRRFCAARLPQVDDVPDTGYLHAA